MFRSLIAAAVLFTFSALVSSAARADATQTPTAVVEMLHATLIDVMKNAEALGYQGRYDRLRPVVDRAFDQKFMAEKSIGLQWKKLEPDEQKLWVETFSELNAANYAGRFTGYDGEHFETIDLKPAPRETVFVNTILYIPSEEDVPLNYRMRETSDGWKVIDILMKGTVSELSLRRSDYSSFIKREGFEKLLEALDTKVANFASEAGASSTAKVDESAGDGTP